MSPSRTVAGLVGAAVLAACGQLPWAGGGADAPGATVVVEVDVQAFSHHKLEERAEAMAEQLRQASPPIRFSGHGVLGDAARIRPMNADERARARALLESAPDVDTMVLSETEDGFLEARYRPAFEPTLARQAAEQTVEPLLRRVQGLSRYATVEVRGDNDLVIHTPGMADPAQITRLLAPGRLTFHLVKGANGDGLPTGALLAQPYPGMADRPEIVAQRPSLTGDDIASVAPATDPQTGDYVVSFRLDGAGARALCRLTRDHVGDRFAVLLDGQVVTAPRINEPICGGSGQISGNFTARSANELVLFLGAGALPAPLRVVEESAPAG